MERQKIIVVETQWYYPDCEGYDVIKAFHSKEEARKYCFDLCTMELESLIENFPELHLEINNDFPNSCSLEDDDFEYQFTASIKELDLV